MTEFVTVNGKKYQTSGYLSGIFSYTPDYIGKLAREEKVLGILIERQWFVEPTSLEVYLQKIAIEKSIQKDQLSQKRKKERLNHERRTTSGVAFTSKKYRAVEVASQALVVLGCGALIGGLSFVSVLEKLTPTVFAEGAKEILVFVGEQMKPSLPASGSGTRDVGSEHLLAGALPSQLQGVTTETYVRVEKNDGTFTVLPNAFSSEQAPSSSASMSTQLVTNEKQIQFSDEVRVAVDALGSYYLEPVLTTDVGSEGSVLVLDVQSSNSSTP